MELEIDGIKYYQPECHCIDGGHICYLRPMPQTVNISLDKILETTGTPIRG